MNQSNVQRRILAKAKPKNAATSANLAITNAQAKDAMAKTLDESHEPITQSQQS